MKICYLILAYNDIGNLKRLVNRLNENAVFIIHIDKKTDIEPFIEAFKSYDNVEFLCNKNRVKIYWGGFSIVQAEINLVKRALQNEKYLKYVLYLVLIIQSKIMSIFIIILKRIVQWSLFVE